MSSIFKKKQLNVSSLKRNEIEKNLGAFDLILMGIGAVIGTGVLVLTGLVAATDAGPGVIFSFIIAAIVCGLVGLCYAEVSSGIPVSGSAYTYTYIAIGEFVAYLTGWILLAVYALTTATVASGWSGYFVGFLEGLGFHLPEYLVTIPSAGGIINLPACGIVLFITFILSLGTKESKKINNMMVLVKLFIIFLFVVVGFFYVKPSNWSPFLPFGIEGVLNGASAVFFAFLGFDAISTSAEEVKNPQRNLPIGIISSLAVCTLIYIAVCLVMTGVLPYSELNVPDAMAHVLYFVNQNTIAGIISIGAIVGIMAVILAYIYAATRVFFAMSRDGLLPKSFSTVSRRTNAPTFSVWIIGTIIILITGFIDLKSLANLSNIGALIAFILVSICTIILRKKHPEIQSGFKVPFMPILPIIDILFCLFLLINLPIFTWLYFGIWLCIGTGVYFFYSRKHTILK